MPKTVTPLAGGFEAATHDAWRALVEKTLKGAGPDTLVSRTADGLAIQPLYAPDPASTPLSFNPRDAGRPWDIRSVVSAGDPEAAKEQVCEDLAGGAASVRVMVDPSGEGGVPLGSAEGLARVLDGVVLEAASVAIDAGFLGVRAAEWLAAAGKASPTAGLAFDLDPLSAFLTAGASPGPIEAHLAAAAAFAARQANAYPKAGLFRASGGAAHEAGGTEAQELALMAASGVAYVRAMLDAGVDLARAFAGVTLNVRVDGDYFLSIAKLRAARLVWEKIAVASGVSAPARLEAQSSGRMLTKADPWTNMIRLTAAGFAGAVGGADIVSLGAFTDALGRPTGFARRQARNTQLVLMEEAHLGRVVDPSAGSGYLDALSDDLARAAWKGFQTIEAAGGAVRALQAGAFQAEVTTARGALAAAIAAGETPILGVTRFVNADATPVDLDVRVAAPAAAPDPRLPGPDSACPPLVPTRLEALA